MRCLKPNSACAWCALKKKYALYPPRMDSLLLQVPQNTPLLSVERIAYTYNDAPMELRRGLYLTDTHYYHNSLS